ncbi:MAG: PH domain-containing protein [Thermoplasmata archaeon]|nr:PH domain-containing protein [Thermoplasmata archaeon]
MDSHDENEKILWKGRRCFRSFWFIILIGILTLWIYGIGIIFIAYAILKWVSIAYIITDKRILEVMEHHAFIKRDINEIEYKDIRAIKISQTFFEKMLKYWKIEINGRDRRIILKTISKEVVDFLACYKSPAA